MYWDTDGNRHDPKEWSPLHESKMVVSYLKNEGNVRDPKKPFFIMVGMNPPHSPYRSLDDCMEEDFNLYKDQPLDSLLIRPNADKKREKAESVRYYFASVTGVDRAFGQILETLKEQGLDKNTIVIFASDHGETMCSQFTDDPKNSPYSESMFMGGCDMIDYHPYDVRISGQTDINNRNIEKIEANCKNKATIRFVTMGDSQRWYDETLDFVNHLNKRDDIDFVIHGGDYSDFGVTDEFLWQRDIMNKLKVPYVGLIGNHDCLGTAKKLFVLYSAV